MKHFYFRAVLLLLGLLFLVACASETDLAGDNPVKSGGAVPGEKTGEGIGSATAGPGSAAAGVRW